MEMWLEGRDASCEDLGKILLDLGKIMPWRDGRAETLRGEKDWVKVQNRGQSVWTPEGG